MHQTPQNKVIYECFRYFLQILLQINYQLDSCAQRVGVKKLLHVVLHVRNSTLS